MNIGRLVKNQESTAVNTVSGNYAKVFLNQSNSDDLSQGTCLNEHLHIQILRL